MHCEVVKLPNGTSAIVTYASAPKRQYCKFCSSVGDKLCDWPVEKPVKIPHEQLSENDTVVTTKKEYRLKVRAVQHFTFCPGYGEFPATMYGLSFPDGRCFLYYAYGNDQITVLRPGTCDHPCCEAHSREVGEDKDYCMEHWRSWESAG